MSPHHPGRPATVRPARGRRRLGLALLAVNLLLPATAAAQTPPGASGTPQGTPGAATVRASVPAGTPPAGLETPAAGTPGAGGTEAPGTATPRPVIVPDCGPGMAGMIAPGSVPPVVPARTTQIRPTAAPTRLPFPLKCS